LMGSSSLLFSSPSMWVTTTPPLPFNEHLCHPLLTPHFNDAKLFLGSTKSIPFRSLTTSAFIQTDIKANMFNETTTMDLTSCPHVCNLVPLDQCQFKPIFQLVRLLERIPCGEGGTSYIHLMWMMHVIWFGVLKVVKSTRLIIMDNVPVNDVHDLFGVWRGKSPHWLNNRRVWLLSCPAIFGQVQKGQVQLSLEWCGCYKGEPQLIGFQ
jgi:hypothetical protein